MSRLERPQSKSSNPATKFLEWKSKDKCFAYYDKDKGENVQVKLPIKVLFMEHYHTILGFHDPSNSGIYSNEVFLIGEEPLTVKARKGGELAEGLYKDIKDKIKPKGAVYHRSVYAMTEEGALINLQLKGSAVASYSEFYKENNHLLDTSWIEITGAKDEQKGSVKYSTPIFELGEHIDNAADESANECASMLQSYMNEYMSKDTPKEEVVSTDEEFEVADPDELDI